MTCSQCGKTVSDQAKFCPFCAAKLQAPAPTVAPQRAWYWFFIGCPLAGACLLALLGVGGYLVYKTVVPKKPPSGEALKPLTEGLPETPSESEGEEGGEAGGIRKDPLAQGATEGKAEPGGESLRPTDNLDQYVGTWEFVGEPGPWGEGFPFKLRRSGDGIAGTAGQDGEVKIDLTSTAVGLEGSSTDRSGWVMRLTLTLKDGLLTVQAQPPDGEVITRVTKKAAG